MPKPATAQILPTIASTATLRTAFANSVSNLLTTYGFDGFDLDWGNKKIILIFS